MMQTNGVPSKYYSKWWIAPGNEGVLFNEIVPSSMLVDKTLVHRPMKIFQTLHPYWILQKKFPTQDTSLGLEQQFHAVVKKTQNKPQPPKKKQSI